MTELSITRHGAQRMGFFTDTTVCIGCKACEVACKQWNDLPADGSQFKKGASYDHTGELSASTWRHVRFVELAEGATKPVDFAHHDVDLVSVAEEYQAPFNGFGDWVFMSDVCKHCTNAGCLDACPTGALIRTEFETVVLQPDVCNGCGYCIPSCPFGVIDRDHDDGRAAKCTLCYDRLEDGLEPACAKSCPTDSIQFGPYDELLDVHAVVARAVLLGPVHEVGEVVLARAASRSLQRADRRDVGHVAAAASPAAVAAGMFSWIGESAWAGSPKRSGGSVSRKNAPSPPASWSSPLSPAP